MKNLEISFTPNKNQLIAIKDWLIEERDKFLDTAFNGFFCNWTNIQSHFENEQMAIVLLDKRPIGFVVWYKSSDLTITIDIAEIHFNFRGKGIGKFFIDQIIEYFRKRGIVAINLQCAPVSSKSYWEKVGFIPYDERMGRNNEHYKLIAPSCPIFKPELEDDNSEVIELWNLETFQANDALPKWTWKVEYKFGTRKLSKPIINPSYYDWRIRWRKGETVFGDHKVKYFGNENILHGGFLVLNSLPDLK